MTAEAFCRCTHSLVRHQHPALAGMCGGYRCDCLRFRGVPSESEAPSASPRSAPLHHEAVTTNKNLDSGEKAPAAKTCSRCQQVKPLDEFHSIGRGRKRPYCRDCYMPGAKAQITTRTLVKSRARARALAELAQRHEEEYRELLLIHMKQANDEAEKIALTVYSDAEVEEPSEPVRLQRGQRRTGQAVEDRIDVGRCAECITHHDRGHVCVACGASPDHPISQEESA